MAFHSTHRNPAYRPDIDGLRAVAVLAVVFYHAGIPGFSGGFVGVDIFFVISGFLITGIVWSEIDGKEFSLQSFYIRRIKRIFPALFAVLIVTSIAAVILLIPRDLEDFGHSVNAATLFSSNFHYLKSAGYFDGPAVEKPLLHTWSLSVEEQFYVAWPLILLLLARTLPSKRVLHVIIGVCVISLIFAEARLITEFPKDAFYFPWCRMWELLVGAALAVTSVSLRPGRLATALGAAGLAGIALALVFYDSSIPFPGLTALLPCAAAALIIASGSSGNPVSRVLSIAPVRRIGLISYSLYLIHWPLFSFAHLYFNEALSLTIRFFIVALSFLLAYLSWRFIETPFRVATIPRFAVFGAAAAAMVCLCVAGFSFSLSGGFPQRIDDKVLRVEEAGWDFGKYCRDVSIPGLSGVAACELGAEKSGPYDFIMWGDSHARHFAPAISILAKDRKLTGVLFWNGGCHPFIDDPHSARNCRVFNGAVARWAANQSFKLAILAGRWNTQRKYLRRYVVQKSPSENTGGLAKTLAFFMDRGIEVAVLDEIPLFEQNPNLCIARGKFYGRSTEACSIQTAAHFLAWRQDLDNYFGFLKKYYNFSVASAAGALCDKEFCRARDGDRLLMADDNHLTEAGSLYVMPYLKVPLLTDEGKDTAAVSETVSSEKSMPAVATPLKPL